MYWQWFCNKNERFTDFYYILFVYLYIRLIIRWHFFTVRSIISFKIIENEHVVYRVKDCMKKFFESLRKCAMEIINFKKKNLKLLTNEQQKSFTIAKFSYICNKKKLNMNMLKMKNIVRLKLIVIIQGNIVVLHIAYVI